MRTLILMNHPLTLQHQHLGFMADVSGFTMADVNFWIPRMAFSEAHQHRATHVKGGEIYLLSKRGVVYIYTYKDCNFARHEPG